MQPLPSDAIKTSKEISQCYVPKNTRQTKANQQRQHLWHKDSWDTTVDYPDVPMSGSQGTCPNGHSCPNGQPLGILTQVPCQGQRACLLAQHVLSTGWTCATIAIKTSKEISRCCAPKKARQTKANQERQHLWHKDSWDTTV